MPVNGMSVGRDYSIGYYDSASGNIVDLGDVQNVRISRQKHSIKSSPYNKVPKFGYIADGYAISFTVTRTGPALENFQLAADTAFNAGAIIKAGYLNETITEADGSTSRYQYTGFVFSLDEIAEISRETVVKQSATGMASEKVPLS